MTTQFTDAIRILSPLVQSTGFLLDCAIAGALFTAALIATARGKMR